MLRHRIAAAVTGLTLVLMTTASVAHAQQNTNGNPQNPGQKGQNNPPLSATPELDSIVLFAVGAAGIGIPFFLQRRRRG